MVEKLKSRTEKIDVGEADGKIKTCFIVMPIADTPGYEQGHFNRVYEHIIKPACNNAGYEPRRADDSQLSNIIILEILKRVVEADMVICDLSSRNPNVMYELGIRQAFDSPVVLLKDELTSRVFDTQHLRDVPYDHSLRIDTVTSAVSKLTVALLDTEKHKSDPDNRSLISLLGIQAAKAPEKREVSPDTILLLDELKNLRLQINRNNSIPKTLTDRYVPRIRDLRDLLLNPEHEFKNPERLKGLRVEHVVYGDGVILDYNDEGTLRVEFGPDMTDTFEPDHFKYLKIITNN